MNEGTHPMDKRVLAVGHSRRVLSNLTRALTEAGFDAQWTTDVATASQLFQPPSVDLVAFGRGVGSADRSRLRSDFLHGNPAVLFVDGRPRSRPCSSRRSRPPSPPRLSRQGSWSTWRPATATSPSPSETTAMSR
jgi:hypothetical protein